MTPLSLFQAKLQKLLDGVSDTLPYSGRSAQGQGPRGKRHQHSLQPITDRGGPTRAALCLCSPTMQHMLLPIQAGPLCFSPGGHAYVFLCVPPSRATAALCGPDWPSRVWCALFQSFVYYDETHFLVWFEIETSWEMCLYLRNIASSRLISPALWPTTRSALG